MTKFILPLLLILCVLIACGEKDVSQPESLNINDFDQTDLLSEERTVLPTEGTKTGNLQIDLVGDEEENVKISGHPVKSFNGVYFIQKGLINDRPWYKSDGNRYLYHYNQAEGGEKSWSLHHVKPDGTKDWYSGGWTEISKLPHPEIGLNQWHEVGNVTEEEITPPSQLEVNVWKESILANMERTGIRWKDADFSSVAKKYKITENEVLKIVLKVNKKLPGQQSKIRFEYYLNKAKEGDPNSIYKVGSSYSFGFTPEGRNEEEALKYYKKAAELGHGDAQWQIAQLYFVGYSPGIQEVKVKIDKVLGYAWNELAIKNRAGHANSNATHTRKYYMKPKMSPDQITKAEALVKEMVKKNPNLIKE